jgi:hypothetical protein
MGQRGPVRSFNWVEWRRQSEHIGVLLQRRCVELANGYGNVVRQRQKEWKSDHPNECISKNPKGMCSALRCWPVNIKQGGEELRTSLLYEHLKLKK